MKYDVIIPVAGKDVNFVPKVVKYVRQISCILSLMRDILIGLLIY